MRVVVLKNGEFEVKDIKGDLESLQHEVGGYIEIPHIIPDLYKARIDMVINEEGKFVHDFDPEIAIINKNRDVMDVIYGPCVFTSYDSDGNTTAINDDQIKILESVLDFVGVLYTSDGKTNFVRLANNY